MRKTMNEHIQRIKYLNNFMLSESPKYSLIDGIEEDDEMPDFMPKPVDANSTNEQDDEVDSLAAGEGVPEPAEPDDTENALEDPESEVLAEPMPEIESAEEPTSDEIQNEIIKTNINVMKELNRKIENLETMTQNLTAQNIRMEKDMGEVREPTNIEKLVQRKDDSHPYYYGLNDMWNGNWFQARRDKLGEKGIKKMEDGSFIADFDELPHMSSYEVKDSFNDY